MLSLGRSLGPRTSLLILIEVKQMLREQGQRTEFMMNRQDEGLKYTTEGQINYACLFLVTHKFT